MRLPVLEGKYFRLNTPHLQVPTARIARPNLPKDIFELRPAQARTPTFEQTHVFDNENRLVGRRVPYQAALSEIPEHDDRAWEGSLLSAGRVPESSAGVAHISEHHSVAGHEPSSSSWATGAESPLPFGGFRLSLLFLSFALFSNERIIMIGLAPHRVFSPVWLHGGLLQR